MCLWPPSGSSWSCLREPWAGFWPRRKKNPGRPLPDRRNSPGSGSKNRKISKETLERTKELLRKNPTHPAKNLKTRLPEPENISIRTIQENSRRLWAFHDRRCQKNHCCLRGWWTPGWILPGGTKTGLLKIGKKWCSQMRVTLSCVLMHYRSKRCRRPRNSNRFDTRFTQKTVKHPPTVMAWGCFSRSGRGGLEFLEKGEMMNGDRYRQVLESKLEFFMHQHNTTHFLQDGGQNCDKVVWGKAPHPPYCLARQLSRPKSHWECLVIDEGTALPEHHSNQHGGLEGGDQEAVGHQDGR